MLGNFVNDAASNKDPDEKQTFIETSEQAIVILEKTAFTETDVCTDNTDENGVEKRVYFSALTKLKQVFVNDIYGNFECFPSPDINSN